MRFDTGLLRQKKLHAQLALFAARNDSGLLTGRKIDSLNSRNLSQKVTETLPHTVCPKVPLKTKVPLFLAVHGWIPKPFGLLVAHIGGFDIAN